MRCARRRPGYASRCCSREKRHALRVLAGLDRITTRLARPGRTADAEVMVLRQALGYCWSVAAAACPAEGMQAIQRWSASPDRDVRWVVRENLKKNRLVRIDPVWVEGLRAKMDT